MRRRQILQLGLSAAVAGSEAARLIADWGLTIDDWKSVVRVSPI